jgi:pimeloyl-ACP methyl ester carboxylesterase
MPGIFRFLSLPFPTVLMNKALRPDVAEARRMFGEIGHETAIEADLIPDVVFERYSELLCHTNTLQHLLPEIRAVATPFVLRSTAKLGDSVLATLAVPTLYRWGDNDTSAKPTQADSLCGLTPGATIEHFQEFGHVLWLDDPVLIAEHATAFLS